jgi:hypothetical protein
MTKKQMIEVVQQKEAESFLQLHLDIKLFGDDHIITSRSRSEWARIHDLMTEMEIQPNNSLPENQSAMNLIIEKNKKEALK